MQAFPPPGVQIYGPYVTAEEARRVGDTFMANPSVGGFVIDELLHYPEFMIILLPPNHATTQNISPAPSRVT